LFAVRPTLARILFFGILVLGLGWSGPHGPTGRSLLGANLPPPRTVYLGVGLSDTNLVALTSAVATARPDAVVLLDSGKAAPANRSFLASYAGQETIAVGDLGDGAGKLEESLGVRFAARHPWKHVLPRSLWKSLFPRAETVVVAPEQPRALLLQSAALAGALKAPLYVLHNLDGATDDLRDWLGFWQTRHVLAAGGTTRQIPAQPGLRVESMADAAEVAKRQREAQGRQGPIRTLVIANPADDGPKLGGMAALAPWLTVQKKAALLLTDDKGENAAAVVAEALRDPKLARTAETLLLAANLEAIPMHKRPNPIPGDKDEHIEMEPLTPRHLEPYSFSVGRLFHEEPGIVALLLARQRLLAEKAGPRKALVASNPGNSLPLLETFSRNTAKELRNAGYTTTTLFGKDVNKDDLRRLLPEHDLFLWEGHHNTLIRDWSFPDWDEPLPPSFVFLQSCLALTEAKTHHLFQRGAVGVLGSSTRTYSASGGACSLAFFDALLYEDQPVGDALRQAKNFLISYAMLKEKRLGKDARRTGANLRAAWAFTLWGDPTLKLPTPQKPEKSLTPIRHEVSGNTITLTLPRQAYDKVISSHFQVEMRPNARLAGLVRREGDEDGQPLVPFVFAEVRLPKAPEGHTPELHTKLPSSHWVFNWDARRQCGYLLVTPRDKDQDELKFRVNYVPDMSEAKEPTVVGQE
jgi:hypothetical protein